MLFKRVIIGIFFILIIFFTTMCQENQTKVIEADSSSHEIENMTGENWIEKGLEYYEQWELEKALECYNKAIEIEPKNILAWHKKASILDIQEKYQEAIECYNKALAIEPENISLLLDKAGAFGYPSSVNKISEQGVSTEQTFVLGLGKTEDALKCYEQVLEIDPENPQAWGHYRLIYL